MTNSNKLRATLLASMLVLTPSGALAQDNTTAANDSALAQTVQPEREDDDDFPWGLLGLVGLAGLLGRKKSGGDVHVDARRDTNR